MKQLTIKLTDGQYELLQEHAKMIGDGVSVADVVMTSIKQRYHVDEARFTRECRCTTAHRFGMFKPVKLADVINQPTAYSDMGDKR